MLKLAGYDAGTLGNSGGYFDPNTQTQSLISTLKRTDANSDKNLTDEEINSRLKKEYKWHPVDLK